jgi:hypothetical protein
MSLNDLSKQIQAAAANDLTEFGLRAAIVAMAVLFIVLALVVKNKLVLAAILAYIVLP